MKDILNPPDSGEQASTAGFSAVAYSLLFASFAFTVADAVMMAKGAVLMAPDIGSTQIFTANDGFYIAAGVACLVALVKACWLGCAAHFWRYRLWGVALAACFIGVMLHIFSMVATTGLAGAGRDAVISARSGAQDTHKRATDAYNAARLHKSSLPSSRPSSAVRAELDAAERDISGAAKADKGPLRTRRDQLRAELAIAMDAERANADLAAASSRLDQMQAPQSRDPQAETIARYLPWAWATPERVGLVLPLLWSLVLEFGAPICGLISVALFALANGQPGTDQTRTMVAAKQSNRGPAWTIENQGWTRGGPARGPRAKVVQFGPETAHQIATMRQSGLSERQIEKATGVPRTTARRMVSKYGPRAERQQA